MKIGVLSDTHIPDASPEIPARVLEIMSRADIILHAGDVTRLSVLQQLEPIAQTFAVFGDQDDDQVKHYLQENHRLEFGVRAVGLVHGHRAWHGNVLKSMWLRINHTRRMNVLYAHVMREFMDSGNQVDVVVFGHSHEPYVKMHGGVLLFNPGSVVPALGKKGTVGMLEVTANSITGKIIAL